MAGRQAQPVSVFDAGIQYWTSRGIAVLDVNYGGSSGYGRAYRQRLYGQWGVMDVDDCVNGARYLAERGEVDGSRLMITRRAAREDTRHCVRSPFATSSRQVRATSASATLRRIARDTHKFESCYAEHLVGPYPARRDLYVERSPISLHWTAWPAR